MAKGLAILFVVLVLKRGILDWLADWRKARHAAPSVKEQDHAAP
jgi:hypothetical protein